MTIILHRYRRERRPYFRVRVWTISMINCFSICARFPHLQRERQGVKMDTFHRRSSVDRRRDTRGAQVTSSIRQLRVPCCPQHSPPSRSTSVPPPHRSPSAPCHLNPPNHPQKPSSAEPTKSRNGTAVKPPVHPPSPPPSLPPLLRVTMLPSSLRHVLHRVRPNWKEAGC